MAADTGKKVLARLLKKCSAKTKHKFGARHTGWEVTLPSGETAYIFERRHHQIYRGGPVKEGGFLTVSDAMLAGKASWMIEHDALRYVKKAALKWIIIFCVDTGDAFIASVEQWSDREIAKDVNLAGYRDTVRHLPISHMVRKNFGSV